MSLPWSESGLLCLAKIQHEIDINGGIDYYRRLVIEENQQNHLKIDRFAEKLSFELLIEHGLNVREMAMVLRRTHDEVTKLLTYYGLR